MKISGYLSLISPIHITLNTDKNKTYIVTRPVFDYESGNKAHIPGISATHLRGGLRRVASQIYIEQYRARGMKIPTELLNSQRHGSTNGLLDTDAKRPIDFMAQVADPIMAIFGGGPRMLSGHSAIKWALALTSESYKSGMVPMHPLANMDKLPEAFKLVGTSTMYPRLDIMKGMDFSEVLSNYVEVIETIIKADLERQAKNIKKAENEALKKAIGDNSKTVNELDSGDKGRGSNLLEYEYIIPNTILFFDVSIDEQLADHVKGFFLEVLRRFFNENRIGGMQRIGFGEDVFNKEQICNLTWGDEHPFQLRGDGSSAEITLVKTGKAAKVMAAYEAWLDDSAAWDLKFLFDASGFNPERAKAIKQKNNEKVEKAAKTAQVKADAKKAGQAVFDAPEASDEYDGDEGESA